MRGAVHRIPWAWRQFAAWWRLRRLSLAGLSPAARALCSLALAAWALAVTVLILLALGVTLPGGADNVGLSGKPPILVYRIVVVLGYVGLGCASATLVLAAAETAARWGRAALIAVGLVGAGLGGSLVQLSREVGTHSTLIPGRELFATGAETVVRVLGILAMVAAATVAAAPRPWLQRWRGASVTAAALPFGLGLAAYIYLHVAAKANPPATRGLRQPQAFAAQSLVALVAAVGFVMSALILWQTVVGVRASRDVGLGFGRAVLRWRSLVLWLLGAKILWLTLGYLEVLPGWLGGNFNSWDATKHDDWLSWLIVAIFAATIALLLLGRKPPEGRNKEPTLAAALAAGGFALFLLAGAIMIFVVAILGVAPDSSARHAAEEAGRWFANGLVTSHAIVVYVAGVVGVALIVIRRWLAAATFLLLFFIWALPYAIDTTINGESESPHALGQTALARLDATITVALLIVTIVWVLRGRDHERSASIATVLVACTLVVYGGQLLGSVWAAGAFYVGLIFPAAYEFIFGARSLNHPRPDRDARILAITGVTAALLVIATVQLGSGFLGPTTSKADRVGRLLLAPPFAAVLIAISLRVAPRRRPAGDTPTNLHLQSAQSPPSG